MTTPKANDETTHSFHEETFGITSGINEESSTILEARSMRGADMNSDHHLVIALYCVVRFFE